MSFSTHMGAGMGGMHLFEATINSNDPTQEPKKVQIRVDYTE